MYTNISHEILRSVINYVIKYLPSTYFYIVFHLHSNHDHKDNDQLHNERFYGNWYIDSLQNNSEKIYRSRNTASYKPS